MKRIRVLLADDHKVVRDGLRLLIDGQRDMRVVGEAGNGKEALQQARELKPDVVVMDLSMPELNGLQATERLKGRAARGQSSGADRARGRQLSASVVQGRRRRLRAQAIGRGRSDPGHPGRGGRRPSLRPDAGKQGAGGPGGGIAPGKAGLPSPAT